MVAQMGCEQSLLYTSASTIRPILGGWRVVILQRHDMSLAIREELLADGGSRLM